MKLLNLGCKIYELDLEDEGTVIQAAKDFGSYPLDLLINCAGTNSLLGLVFSSRQLANVNISCVVAGGNGLDRIEETSAEMMRNFRVTTIVSTL